MTLDEVIARARASSVDARVALNSLRSAYWSYRSYLADYLPEVSLTATVPSVSQRYSSYQNPDGSYTYVRSSGLQMNGNIGVTQKVWATGGSVSLTTSLDMSHQMGSNSYSRYMAIPVALTFNQPLFASNDMKWQRRISPLSYKVAQINFFEASENVARQAIAKFFNLISAREDLAIVSQNLDNARKLHEVALAKRRMGIISENDVLQLRLNLLNAEALLTSARSTLTARQFELANFLDFDENLVIIPLTPDRLPHLDLEYGRVLELALANSDFETSQTIRRLQADRSVASAKGNLRRIDLYVKLGLSGTGDTPAGSYSPLKDDEVVSVGFNIPLIDWGKRRGQVKVAESNRQVVQSQLESEAMQFRQDLFVLVDRFNNQQRQVEIAALSDTIAQKRYDTNVETFMIGRISTLDLANSQTEKDNRRVSYFNALYQYWSYYYQIRAMTLHDFVNDTGIDGDIELILKQQ